MTPSAPHPPHAKAAATPKACETFTGASGSARYMLTFKQAGANLAAFAYSHLSAVTLANDRVLMVDFGAYAVRLDGEGLSFVAEKIIRREVAVIHLGGANPDLTPPVRVAKMVLIDKSKEAEEDG